MAENKYKISTFIRKLFKNKNNSIFVVVSLVAVTNLLQIGHKNVLSLKVNQGELWVIS